MMGLGPMIHGHENLFWMVYHDVGALSHKRQITIRHHSGYFKDDVPLWIDTRHFQVNPNQMIAQDRNFLAALPFQWVAVRFNRL